MDVATAVIRQGPTRSDVHRLRAAGPLRLLSPRAAGNAAWIVTSSFGGGLVDGDDVALEVEIDAGAIGLVTTQASSKIYKGSSRQRLDVRVRGNGCALLVPDPIVPYRDASYTQRTSVALDHHSSLVLCDVVTAGRIAHGERWACTRFDSKLTVAIDERVVLRDRILLDHDIASRMSRFAALGTALLVGPRVGAFGRAALELGGVEQRADLVVAGSPVVDGAILRVAGTEIERVIATIRTLLRPACEELGEDPWSRKW